MAVVFPLSVHSSGRYLVDAKGAPFFVSGDSPWSLMVEPTLTEARQFLDDRARRGCTALIVNLIEWQFSSHTPKWRNAAGDLPFADVNSMDVTTDAYFTHAVNVCNEAAARGIALWLTPSYLGFSGASPVEGWYDTMVTNGATKLRNYGRYLGTKFASVNNIIWMNGGDRNPADANLVDQIALGIADNDSSKIFTGHPAPESNPRTVYSGSPWTMSLGGVYSYSTTLYDGIATAYAESAAKPFPLLESRYENMSDWTAQRIRRNAWWAITFGACGHFYGNDPVWRFQTGWQTSLSDPGAQHMNYLRNIVATRAWQKLVPDTSRVTMTAGSGTNGQTDYAGCARASDGSFVLAYLPTNRTVTFDMTKLAGRCKVQWLDPTNGTWTAATGGAASIANAGSRSFTPPGNNAGGDGDWVILIEATSGEPGGIWCG